MTNHFSFDELYQEISQDWLSKSEKLQARRWQKISKKDKPAA